MKETHITMTMEEHNRIHAISCLAEGKLNLEKAAVCLQRSERTIYRWKAKLFDEGPSGLIHGNRGRESPKKTDTELVEKILSLRRDVYYDVNDTHLVELLEGREKIRIGRSTLQRILRRNGLESKKKRRPRKHRSRRPRKEAMGAMLQMDGSKHAWTSLGPTWCLHGAVDDATSTVWAHFEEEECTYGYFEVMRSVFEDRGLPLSLYPDRHSIFFPVQEKLCEEAQRRGMRSESQFGRAMRELGVQMIPAYSPQAKGRIERVWQTFQDRLVAEMRIAEVRTMDEARLFLKGFLERFNKQFTVPAHRSETAFRKAPSKRVLDDILCHKEFRVVKNDHTVQYHSLVLQIPKQKKWRSLAQKTVEIWDRQDGLLKIVYDQTVVYQQQTHLEDVARYFAA